MRGVCPVFESSFDARQRSSCRGPTNGTDRFVVSRVRNKYRERRERGRRRFCNDVGARFVEFLRFSLAFLTRCARTRWIQWRLTANGCSREKYEGTNSLFSVHPRRFGKQVLPERLWRSTLYQALVGAFARVQVAQDVSPLPHVGSGVGSKPRGGLEVVGVRPGRSSVRERSRWQGERDGNGYEEGAFVDALLGWECGRPRNEVDAVGDACRS